MKRREFVQHTVATGALCYADPTQFINMNKKHIGVQLWSVRDAADKDPAGVLERLAAMGYPEVEGHQYTDGKFYSFTPLEFKSVLKNAGICMTSAHTGIDLHHWNNSTKSLATLAYKTIEDHAAIGVKQLICPWVNEEWRKAENLPALCEILNAFGHACKKEGIQFGYHNHDFEFRKIDGVAMLDHLMNKTDPEYVIMQLDLYWVAYAKEDPAYWINHLNDRIHSYHVKDMAESSKRETIEVGEGVIDFVSLFRLPPSKNVKYYIVELEDYKTNSMQGVETSLSNLKKILKEV